MTRFLNEKYARYEVNIQRKCENKRVDNLFKMIEQQNTDYRKFSYC
ncbi:unknown [Eubacterium sp. CAG:603]|nr:unknown [Eubacterium sp. CAG:603]